MIALAIGKWIIMGLQDNIDKGIDAVKKATENVKDAVSEAGHRSAAEGEQAKRDVAGDQMTGSEKVGSVFNQGKENVQAEVDATKRDVRNNT